MKRKTSQQNTDLTIGTDPASAAERLNGILASGNQGKLMLALRQFALELGGIGRFAEQAGFNRTQLYLTLSSRGNPDIRRLTAILEAMGLQLAVQPLAKAKSRRAQSRRKSPRRKRA